VPSLERAGIPFEWLTPGDAARLFPSVALDDVYRGKILAEAPAEAEREPVKK